MVTRNGFLLVLIGAFCSGQLLGNVDMSEDLNFERVVEKLEAHKALNEDVAMIVESAHPCPPIYSAWHTEHVAKEEARDEKKKNRELGRRIVKITEDWSKDLRSTDELTEVHQKTGMVLSFADWVAGEPCYGNLIVAARCQDVAAIGVCKLLIDLEFPMEKIGPLLDRLNADWYEPSARGEAINRELGQPVLKTSGEAEEILEAIDHFWRGGYAVLSKQRCTEEIWESSTKYWTASGRATVGEWMAAVREVFPKYLDYTFFEDDRLQEVREPWTTYNTWDMKRHELLVTGFRKKNLFMIDSLAQYRRLVGRYPHDASEFRSEWIKNEPPGAQRCYSTAWLSYWWGVEGVFMDEDAAKTAPPEQHRPVKRYMDQFFEKP